VKTRTTTRSCRDPETAVILFTSCPLQAAACAVGRQRRVAAVSADALAASAATLAAGTAEYPNE